jgi:uncharacterized protein YggU (UPF0235/DUF167 family)
VASDGIVLAVRLTPRGGRDAIDGIETRADGQCVLKVRVRALPEKGAANDALLMLLARVLAISRSEVSLVAGATGRLKRIWIAGDPAGLVASLATAASAG